MPLRLAARPTAQVVPYHSSHSDILYGTQRRTPAFESATPRPSRGRPARGGGRRERMRRSPHPPQPAQLPCSSPWSDRPSPSQRVPACVSSCCAGTDAAGLICAPGAAAGTVSRPVHDIARDCVVWVPRSAPPTLRSHQHLEHAAGLGSAVRPHGHGSLRGGRVPRRRQLRMSNSRLLVPLPHPRGALNVVGQCRWFHTVRMWSM